MLKISTNKKHYSELFWNTLSSRALAWELEDFQKPIDYRPYESRFESQSWLSYHRWNRFQDFGLDFLNDCKAGRPFYRPLCSGYPPAGLHNSQTRLTSTQALRPVSSLINIDSRPWSAFKEPRYRSYLMKPALGSVADLQSARLPERRLQASLLTHQQLVCFWTSSNSYSSRKLQKSSINHLAKMIWKTNLRTYPAGCSFDDFDLPRSRLWPGKRDRRSERTHARDPCPPVEYNQISDHGIRVKRRKRSVASLKGMDPEGGVGASFLIFGVWAD